MTPTTKTTRIVSPAGFTLVELLAVMLILAVLMTLVVGAAQIIFQDVYKDETKNSMNIIMSAIKEYRRSTGSLPPEGDAAWVNALRNNAKSRALITNLDEKCWKASDNDEFKDAWGNPIKYSPSGGLAGAPGLTSGGPDGEISTEEDNVRYDK